MPGPVLDVHSLRKVYRDGTEAVKGITFQVQEGEFFGLLGPNGAGKSTTIKMLITLLDPTSGEATVAGYDLRRQPDAIRTVIGYAAQETGVDPDLTGRENLDLQARLYHLDGPTRRRRITELLDLVDLARDADRRAGSYSGGMRKRLDLATGLIHQPRILFLDEPTTGLDPQNRAGLWGYLERLNRQEGMTILLTTHYLEEADRLAGRIAIIDHGEIVAAGSPQALKAELGGDVITLRFDSDAGQERARGLLSRHPDVRSLSAQDGGLQLVVAEGGRTLPRLLSALDDQGITVADQSLTRPTLDDVFLRHTGSRMRDDAAQEGFFRKGRRRFGGFMRGGARS